MNCREQVKEYMDSGEFQERQEGAIRIQRDAKLLEGSRKVDKVISQAQTIKLRFANIDKEDAELARQEADEYLGLALQSYLAVLRQGNGSRSQAAVYRLVALWFANAESNPVLKSVPTTLPKVSLVGEKWASYKNDSRSQAGSLCLCCTNLQLEWRFLAKATTTTQQQLCTTWSCAALRSIPTTLSLSSLPSFMPRKMRNGWMEKLCQAVLLMQGVLRPLRLLRQ